MTESRRCSPHRPTVKLALLAAALLAAGCGGGATHSTTSPVKPFSARGERQALVVLGQLKSCLHSYGFEDGAPVVRRMRRGGVYFGFTHYARATTAAARARLARAQQTCETRVDASRRLHRIMAAERKPS